MMHIRLGRARGFSSSSLSTSIATAAFEARDPFTDCDFDWAAGAAADADDDSADATSAPATPNERNVHASSACHGCSAMRARSATLIRPEPIAAAFRAAEAEAEGEKHAAGERARRPGPERSACKLSKSPC